MLGVSSLVGVTLSGIGDSESCRCFLSKVNFRGHAVSLVTAKLRL